MGLFDKLKSKSKKEVSLPAPALKPAVPEDLPEFPVDISAYSPLSTTDVKSQFPKQSDLFKEPLKNQSKEDIFRQKLKKSFEEESEEYDETYEDSRFDQKLPRQDDERIIRDVINPFPKKPFVFEKPYLFEVESEPVTLKDIEEEEFGGRIAPVEKSVRFSLHETLRKPLFIRTDRYKQVKKYIDSSRNSAKILEESVLRLENLKLNADSEYELFHKKIEDIQRKLIYTDRTIFKEW